MLPVNAQTQQMLNFDAVVRRFWPRAVRDIEESKDRDRDEAALEALNNREHPKRRDDVRDWLRSYAVLQGLTTGQRDRISEAVLAWADASDPRRDVGSPEALNAAHAEVAASVRDAYARDNPGATRQFTSLASKALWLRYPDSVPIFDRNANNALHVISKLEGITVQRYKEKYKEFVHAWMGLYSKYKGTLDGLDMGTCPYRVRVFDRILWLIGEPTHPRP